MTSLWTRAEELGSSDCMTLLRSVRLGRVGLTGPDGPEVLPVNHAVLDGTVVFRTGLYTSLAEASRSGVLAFEADELDDRLQSGWSVLVVGEASHVQDREELAAVFGHLDQPWAPGERPVVARIVPSRVTGRRFFKN